MSSFKHKPAEPDDERCVRAYTILENAHLSATSFLKTFEASRGGKQAGTTTDAEQDLLRAVLVFASAGLDAMLKQLIEDALPGVITASEAAQATHEGFLSSLLAKPESSRLIAKALTSADPRGACIEFLTTDLTKASLQSADQVMRVAGFFGISSNDLPKANDLRPIFGMRNQISHEMDADFSKKNRSRRQRTKQQIVDGADALFNVAGKFLTAVDKTLSSVKSAHAKVEASPRKKAKAVAPAAALAQKRAPAVSGKTK